MVRSRSAHERGPSRFHPCEHEFHRHKRASRSSRERRDGDKPRYSGRSDQLASALLSGASGTLDSNFENLVKTSRRFSRLHGMLKRRGRGGLRRGRRAAGGQPAFCFLCENLCSAIRQNRRAARGFQRSADSLVRGFQSHQCLRADKAVRAPLVAALSRCVLCVKTALAEKSQISLARFQWQHPINRRT